MKIDQIRDEIRKAGPTRPEVAQELLATLIPRFFDWLKAHGHDPYKCFAYAHLLDAYSELDSLKAPDHEAQALAEKLTEQDRAQAYADAASFARATGAAAAMRGEL